MYVFGFPIPKTMGYTLCLALGFAAGILYIEEQNPKVFSTDHVASWNVCFSPRGNCEKLVIKALSGAQKTIHLRAYSFTSKPIADALIDAKERGVKLHIQMDKSQLEEKYSQLRKLKQAGIPVQIEKAIGIAHNKVIVIDGHILLTGSYNWTNAAQKRNNENLLLVDDRMLAQAYLGDF